MNFSSFSPSHGQQSSQNFCSMGHSSMGCSPPLLQLEQQRTGCSSLGEPFSPQVSHRVTASIGHPCAPAWGSCVGYRWISASPWISTGCRDTVVSPWSAPQAAEQSELQHMEHLFLLFLLSAVPLVPAGLFLSQTLTPLFSGQN